MGCANGVGCVPVREGGEEVLLVGEGFSVAGGRCVVGSLGVTVMIVLLECHDLVEDVEELVPGFAEALETSAGGSESLFVVLEDEGWAAVGPVEELNL